MADKFSPTPPYARVFNAKLFLVNLCSLELSIYKVRILYNNSLIKQCFLSVSGMFLTMKEVAGGGDKVLRITREFSFNMLVRSLIHDV